MPLGKLDEYQTTATAVGSTHSFGFGSILHATIRSGSTPPGAENGRSPAPPRWCMIGSDSEGKFGHQCPSRRGYWRSHGSPVMCPYCATRGDRHKVRFAPDSPLEGNGFATGDRGFEFCSLHQRVRCEPDFRPPFVATLLGARWQRGGYSGRDKRQLPLAAPC
jgi:hypothetical protein